MAESTAPAPLTVENVTAGYPGGPAVVRQVSVAAEAGRVVALAGPNAAGKTTLLRLMLGQLPCRAGSVHVDGGPVEDLSAPERARKIGYVPQRGSVTFGYTVEEVVELGGFAGPAGPERVAAVLGECELEHLRRRPFAELSVGQQQRVLIARAMVQLGGEGVALLADEPGSGMDLKHLHVTMHRLRGLAAAGLAVIVVLHDLNLAARYADDVWLMDKGQMVAAGPWEQVLVPERLEPVYGVTLAVTRPSEDDRPLFSVVADGKVEVGSSVGS
ncbi:MAG: ABC transporter ATP-binding protein [Phycisphaeraceae bacterium]|nr:ABC transporter ATP-binding protein [Phycisphaeraceae bacterium]